MSATAGTGGSAVIHRVGTCTSLGLTSASSYAAFVAGIVRFTQLGASETRVAPLELLTPALSSGERVRLLAEYALEQLKTSGPLTLPGRRIGVFVGVGGDKDIQCSVSSVLSEWFFRTGGMGTGAQLLPFVFFSQSRSAFFFALEAALSSLSQHQCELAIVGAVDSLCSPESIASLQKKRRLRAGGVPEGIIPGEAASFFLMTTMRASSRAESVLGRILHAAVGCELRHFDQDQPNLAQGLTKLFRAFRMHPEVRGRRVDRLFTCETGEPYWAEELGKAYLRNEALMPEPFVRAQAGQGFGDVGAAAGAVMLSMGVEALSRDRSLQVLPAPLAMVYSSADDGHLGGCLLERAAPHG